MTRKKTIGSQKQRTNFKNQSSKSKINIHKKKDFKIKILRIMTHILRKK